MNAFYLGFRLRDLQPTTLKRYYLHSQLTALDHDQRFAFDSQSSRRQGESELAINLTEHAPNTSFAAHKAGTSCVAVDQTSGQYLVSAGGDSCLRLWNLQDNSQDTNEHEHVQNHYRPSATLSKVNPEAHTHSVTSLSIFPFDPVPSTILSTSFDHSLLVTQITPSELRPLHKFALDYTAYSHAISPVADASSLVAVGTEHPAPRLLDLRSALAVHALPGHTGSIYSLVWHPRQSQVLVSSSSSGQILCFDIRRASPAFASFNMEDSLGVLDSSRQKLNFSDRAHGDAITGILFNHDGSKLISASRDQRIRMWDIATGRNDLVHFGPRIRNSRQTEYKPVIAPAGTSGLKPGRDLLFWPNDDGRGEIFVHDLCDGSVVQVLKTKNVMQTTPAVPKKVAKGRKSTGVAAASNAIRVTAAGRINSLAFGPVGSQGSSRDALVMYSGHGDGKINVWTPDTRVVRDEEAEIENDVEDSHPTVEVRSDHDTLEQDRKRKRKRDLLEMVEGLTKRPMTFS